MSDSTLPIKCKKCGSTKLDMSDEFICTNCSSNELDFVVDENNPLDVLKKKLVYGKITQEEYDQRKKEFSHHS